MNIKQLLKKVMPRSLRRKLSKIKCFIIRHKQGLKMINSKYDLTVIGNNGTDTYFGYYDISPFNSKNQIIYVELPKGGTKANIILNDVKGKNGKVVAETKAFNTQQGCRLRWLPGSDSIIMFNDEVDNKYVCRTLNLETGEEIIHKNPIYDISHKGDKYATLNFERLGVLRPGYGYTNRQYIPATDLSKESLKICDFSNDKIITEISYKQIADALGTTCDYKSLYLNHLSFSPSGNKILFFAIEIKGKWHQANLLTYNLQTKEIYVHEKEYKVSHYTWLDEDTILCTAIKGNSIQNMQCRYYLYKEDQPRQVVAENILTRDGHPTYLNENTILTDTYPNYFGFQELFLLDIKDLTKRQLVYSNSVLVATEEFRTDMHPRFNSDKTLICYDANVYGERRLYILSNWKK